MTSLARPVAVRRLAEVHEVHVDLVPGQLNVELGVKMTEGLGELREPVDPHLGGREGVHPEDEPGAFGVGISLAHE